MNIISWRLGNVAKVNVADKTAKVTILPDMDEITVQLDSPMYRQYIPLVGQSVLLMGMGDDQDPKIFNSIRILTEFGSTSPEMQKSKPLNVGEVLSEGSGGGFSYKDNNGNVMLGDGNLSNTIQLLVSTAISMVGDSLVITVKDVGHIKILPVTDSNATSKIEVVKTKAGSTTPLATISIQDDKINIESTTVNLGTSPVAAAVHTLSGVPGDYSIDIMTGRPIPGSSVVKVAS